MKRKLPYNSSSTMIQLHKFISYGRSPDLSPFGVKMESYLRMAGIPYECVLGDPRKAPKGKLPFIVHDGKQLADTHFIISHLKQRYGDSVDGHLTNEERAKARVLQSMLEEHLYFVLLAERWLPAEAWTIYRPVVASDLAQIGVPRPLLGLATGMLRKVVIKSLHGQGTGRHTRDERIQLGRELISALSDLLGNQSYFLGDRASSVDACAFAMLASISWIPLESPLKAHIASKANLVAFCERFHSAYWAGAGARDAKNTAANAA